MARLNLPENGKTGAVDKAFRSFILNGNSGKTFITKGRFIFYLSERMPTEELLDLHLAFRALSDEDADDGANDTPDSENLDDDELEDDDTDSDDGDNSDDDNEEDLSE